MRALALLLASIALPAPAMAENIPDAQGVTVLRGSSAPPAPVVQQQTVVVQPTTIVQYPIVQSPYLSAVTPLYFLSVPRVVHHRHR